MNHSDALYKRIYQKLLTEIEEGMYKDGQRLPTEKELSQKYYVSRITAQKAMRALADEGKIVRVIGKGSYIADSFQPDMELKRKKRRCIALIMGSLGASFGLNVVYGALDAAEKHGVDLIKIMATGGVMTPGVEPGSAQLTMEEMKAAIDEAHKADRKTATHAQGTQGIKNALHAGIDSIEHGIFLDDECIDWMVEHGTYLVPTLAAPRCILDAGVEKGMKDYVLRKANLVVDAHIESFKKAYQRGVKIAMGTDAGTPYNFHNNSAFELELMVANGMKPMDAIVASTRNGADCIGVLKDYGTIEAGKVADIIAIEGDPLQDISCVRKVRTVYKAGEKLKG